MRIFTFIFLFVAGTLFAQDTVNVCLTQTQIFPNYTRADLQVFGADSITSYQVAFRFEGTFDDFTPHSGYDTLFFGATPDPQDYFVVSGFDPEVQPINFFDGQQLVIIDFVDLDTLYLDLDQTEFSLLNWDAASIDILGTNEGCPTEVQFLAAANIDTVFWCYSMGDIVIEDDIMLKGWYAEVSYDPDVTNVFSVSSEYGYSAGDVSDGKFYISSYDVNQNVGTLFSMDYSGPDPTIDTLILASEDEQVIPSAKCPVSIQNSPDNSDMFKVFPNPSYGPIHFQSNEVMDIQVYNVLGKLVTSGTSKDFSISLNPGTYVYRVVIGDVLNSGLIIVE